MRKYISLFEEFEDSDIKSMTGENTSGWTSVRDVVQRKEPFTILCFKTSDGYTKFLNSTDCDYIKQEYYTDIEGDMKGHISYPSVFIPQSKLEVIGSDDAAEEYDAFCIIYQKGDNAIAKYDDEKMVMGNELVSSLDVNDVKDDDHFKIGSTFYKFITFLG